jgi:hypothetical protein
MEIQDFAPHMLQVQLVFKSPTPLVIDQRGALITMLHDEFGDGEANIEQAAVEALSEDKREQFRVGNAQLVASIENFDDLDAAGEKLGRFAERALAMVDVPAIGLVRARSVDLAAAAAFEDLRDALAEAFGTPRAELAEIAGQPLSDIGWTFEFADAQPQIGLRFGPMRASQIKTLLRDERDGAYPGEFLFLDVDFAHPNVDLEPEQAVTRLAHSIESNRKVVARVTDWLMEKLK